MINLFREKHITQIFEVAHQSVAQKIQNIPEHVLMNVAEAELVDEFFQMCILEPLEIDLKNPEVETFMKDIPGSSFPSEYDVNKNKAYPCAAVSYSFDILQGDPELLCANPTKRTMTTGVRANVKGGAFEIVCQTLYSNTNLSEKVIEEVRAEMKRIKSDISAMVDAVNNDISRYNTELANFINQQIMKRKSDLQKLNDQNQALKDI